MRTFRFLGASIALLCLFFVGCGGPLSGPMDEPHAQPKLSKKMEPLVWTPNDNPQIFDTNLEYSFSKLPLTGSPKRMAWAGGYWPTYNDSLNHKWEGPNTDSISKKYEKAFGKTGLEKKISEEYGILSRATTDKKCTVQADCDPGHKCSKQEGGTQSYCVLSWTGICHGWAPASVMEPEPKKPVTHNGVTFKVNDIKALMSLLYTKMQYKFVSLRCNRDDSKGKINYDKYGRPANEHAECRDTNAGTFHVLLSNFLGIRKQSFVEDRVNDIQVWNHPVVGYRVTHNKEVTAQEANTLVATTYGGHVEKDKWFHHPVIKVKAGDTFEVVMAGNGDADLYVRFGSQATDKDYDCRPYKDGSAESCKITVPSGATEAYVSIKGYASYSAFDFKLTTPETYPVSYLFNSAAKKFIHVKVEVDYITESESTTDGNLSTRIKEFTHTDYYEYILELDSNGVIKGGEWLSRSKRIHPDFLWLPGKLIPNAILKGEISYNDVKSLLTKSVDAKDAASYSWNGNGSLISYSTGTATGFGITQDVSRIHPTSDKLPAVFFQWEVDSKDGTQIEIAAPGMTTATITYGPWNDRSKDRSYQNVTLPFVLDPKKDGFPTTDGAWYVIRVDFAQHPTKVITVQATPTTKSASAGTSTIAETTDIDGTHTWNGNASIVSYSTGTATGFGITQDVTRIHPTSAKLPVVFFQWEVDHKDGGKLEIAAPGMTTATITYGSWSSRAQDKVHTNVKLPFTLDPKKDGFAGNDGNWYVIKVAFPNKPTKVITVQAKATQ